MVIGHFKYFIIFGLRVSDDVTIQCWMSLVNEFGFVEICVWYIAKYVFQLEHFKLDDNNVNQICHCLCLCWNICLLKGKMCLSSLPTLSLSDNNVTSLAMRRPKAQVSVSSQARRKLIKQHVLTFYLNLEDEKSIHD